MFIYVLVFDCNLLLISSDDDFEPYDLSNDVVKPKSKSPVYLRDCMEGELLYSLSIMYSTSTFLPQTNFLYVHEIKHPHLSGVNGERVYLVSFCSDRNDEICKEYFSTGH